MIRRIVTSAVATTALAAGLLGITAGPASAATVHSDAYRPTQTRMVFGCTEGWDNWGHWVRRCGWYPVGHPYPQNVWWHGNANTVWWEHGRQFHGTHYGQHPVGHRH